MLYRFIKPSPPLSDYVENFWLYEGYAPPQLRDRILPSGTIELVINLLDDELRVYTTGTPERCNRFSGAMVSGAYGSYFVIDTLQEASLLGVHFRRGGAFPFFGLPSCELADAHVNLETLWGPTAPELRERVCAAGTPEERFRLIEQALLSRLSQGTDCFSVVPVALHAVRYFEQPGGVDTTVQVRDVADQLGLSHRRFIQVFKEQVGLTPKLFCRVQRFQRTLARIGPNLDLDWAQLAAECGYFDQSHLIHEFFAFSGFRPTDYLQQQNYFHQQGRHIKRNHLPVSEQGKFFPIADSSSTV